MRLPAFKSIDKRTWFMICAVLAVMIVWISVILPALGRLQSTAQAIAATQTTEASSVEATSNLISVLQRKTLLEDQAKQLDSAFIDQSNPVAFVSRLEELGADHHLTLDIILQEPDTTTVKPVAETPVTIHAAGTLADTFNFLNAVLTDPVFLKVTSIEYSTPSDTPGIVSLHLETLSYWRSYANAQ